ncbi:MAG: hypothetical protein ACYTAN_04925 [Planctomycetota bacterium]
MIERITVILVVLASLGFLGHRLFLWISGRSTSCSACGKSCRRARRP